MYITQVVQSGKTPSHFTPRHLKILFPTGEVVALINYKVGKESVEMGKFIGRTLSLFYLLQLYLELKRM